MLFKELSIADLKSEYIDRHGFIFVAASQCHDLGCDKIGRAIVGAKLTDELPEFVVKFSDREFAFVYPKGCSVNMPELLKKASDWSEITRAFKIDSLSSWLREMEENLT
jgi:hypothetical protein